MFICLCLDFSHDFIFLVSGWFSVVNEDGKPRALHRTIQEIAKTRSQYFLVETAVRAYRDEGRPTQKRKDDENEREDDDCESSGKVSSVSSSPGEGPEAKLYAATVIESGSILKAVGIFADEKMDTNKEADEGTEKSETESTEKNSETETKENDERGGEKEEEDKKKSGNFYLKCTNNKNEFIYIPYHRQGDFYPIARPGSQNPHKIHGMSNLLKSFSLPLTVRLVQGMTPSKHRTLRLLDKVTEDVFVACCLADSRRIMLELSPKDPEVTFERVSDMNAIQDTELYKSCCSWCADKSPLYLRQIKVGSCFQGRTTLPQNPETNEETDSHLFYSYVDIGKKSLEERMRNQRQDGGRTTFTGMKTLFPINMNKLSRYFRRRNKNRKGGKEKCAPIREQGTVSEKQPIPADTVTEATEQTSLPTSEL